MMHPRAKRTTIDDGIGDGLVVDEPIPAGTLVWVEDEDDEVLTRRKLEQLSTCDRERWGLLGWATTDYDVVMCGDLARYVNHSCDPNTLCFGQRAMIATRDVAAGEELTEDYLFLNRIYRFTCRCGAPRCRGQVNVTGPARDAIFQRGDRLLSSLAPRLFDVPQPLMHCLSAEERRWLVAFAAGQVRHPPLRQHALTDPLDVEAIARGEAPLPRRAG